MSKGIIEICCNSLQSALNAQEAGAGRIELCSGLMEGGMTPSLGLIEEVVSQLQIPVYVLVRPRGGDFCFTNDEFKVMLRDIEWCKQSGVKGIVSGALTPHREIDSERMPVLINATENMDFTFHRAFDVLKNPFDELAQLKSYGCKRILTSGGKETAYNGIENISLLVKEFPGQVSIMPGGGVNEENIREIILKTGINEIHFSASVGITAYPVPGLEQFTTVTDFERVLNMISLARQAFAK